MLCNKRSHCSEKPAHLNEEQPPLAETRESPQAAKKTQYNQKFKNKSQKKKNIYIYIKEVDLFHKEDACAQVRKESMAGVGDL